MMRRVQTNIFSVIITTRRGAWLVGSKYGSNLVLPLDKITCKATISVGRDKDNFKIYIAAKKLCPP